MLSTVAGFAAGPTQFRAGRVARPFASPLTGPGRGPRYWRGQHHERKGVAVPVDAR